MNKKAILKHTDNKSFDYPIYVPLVFIFLGGFTGGVIIGLIHVIFTMMLHDGKFEFAYLLLSLIYGIFGIFFGFVPALLMGFYVAYKKFVIKNWYDYIHLYVVGTMLSAIYFGF